MSDPPQVAPNVDEATDERSVRNRTVQIQAWIDLLRAGDADAREKLIEVSQARLRKLAHDMLAGDRVRLWEETDDILQDALLQLHKSLADVQPESVRDFFRLAAFHIRRAVLNMARHYFGPQGMGANQPGNGNAQHKDSSWANHPEHESTPSKAAARREECLRVQEAIDALHEPLREVTELLWFHGLGQADAARVLDVSVRTVRRRWQQARIALADALDENTPCQLSRTQHDDHVERIANR